MVLAADFADFAEKPETVKRRRRTPLHQKKSSRVAQALLVCSAENDSKLPFCSVSVAPFTLRCPTGFSSGLAQARSRNVPAVSPARRSRNASPSSVQASTVAMSARPGAIATQGADTIKSRPPAIMFPQLGCGG